MLAGNDCWTIKDFDAMQMAPNAGEGAMWRNLADRPSGNAERMSHRSEKWLETGVDQQSHSFPA
ncbi:hypothetical protein PCA20602_02766 [Pandoraea capi]|uniref:Uncharacterized protein n=1 Tax=Pandoraea capi TaxID=2508286 RepID=A0ABY6W136_9BURK|nr:hypothetical protein [Pandoraea capi]VVE13583.1 hypothetical protein PCA20602_02766 [Pandoraea capi]